MLTLNIFCRKNMDMIDRTCCRSAFCSRSHCSGKFENFSDIWKNCFLQKMMNVRETKIMKNKRAICITIICVLGVVILLLLLFFSFEPRQSIQRQSSYRKHRSATKAPQAIRIMNPNFLKVNMRLFLIEVK